MQFKKILLFRVFQKNYTLLLLLPFLAITGIVFWHFYNDLFDNNNLQDISLHNSGIFYRTFNQIIFLNTLIQFIIITKVCINSILTRSPPYQL